MVESLIGCDRVPQGNATSSSTAIKAIMLHIVPTCSDVVIASSMGVLSMTPLLLVMILGATFGTNMCVLLEAQNLATESSYIVALRMLSSQYIPFCLPRHHHKILIISLN